MHEIEIVAECGVNFQGSMEMAATMIERAKRCGADTAKFQYYDPEAVLDPEHPELKPWWDVILKTKLRPRDIRYLKGVCDDVGIGFLCSVFDPADVPLFEEIGMERYKIASRSIHDAELHEAIAKTGKPVLLSWGHFDRERGFPRIHKVKSGKVLNLYCVSKYPAPLKQICFFNNPGMKRWKHSKFAPGQACAGFSDHTLGLAAAVTAMALGARIIEKHFTLDRTLPGPDHAGSADPTMLRALCMLRDGIEEILYK